MKKLVAILLAALMLLAPVALAENTAAILTLTDIVATNGGESVPLTGLCITAAIDAENDPTFILTADDGTDYLAAAAMRIDAKGQMDITLENLDATYTADIMSLASQQGIDSSVAGMASQSYEELPELMRTLVPAMDELVLPAFSGVTIPKMDLSELLSGFITGESNGVSEFTIHYGQFVSLLDMVKQYASLAGSQIPNLDEVLSAIDEMKANGQGFMVRGTIEDNGRRQNVTASLIPVDNFVEMDSAVLKLSVSSEENTIVAIGMPEGQSGVPMFILNLLSDPAKPSLTAEMSIGEASISFRLFPEDGLQKMTFDVSSDGEDAFKVAFGYGNTNGRDLLNFEAFGGGSALSLNFDTAMGADGVRTGTVSFTADDVVITGNIAMQLSEEAPVEIAWPENRVSIEELDGEAMNEAMAPLMAYFENLEA